MTNTVNIEKIEMTENGFEINGNNLVSRSKNTVFVINKYFNIFTKNNIDIEKIVTLLNDKSVMNRVIIESDDYEKSEKLVEKINSLSKITCSYILTNFKNKKCFSSNFEQNKDISFVYDQQEISKFDNLLMRLWKDNYYSTLGNFISGEDASSQLIEHQDSQKDYTRFIAIKNEKPVAELGYVDVQHHIFDQKVRAMSAMIDADLEKGERKYIWNKLFEQIQNEHLLFSAIYSFNKQSINLFLKNGYKINHLLMYPY